MFRLFLFAVLCAVASIANAAQEKVCVNGRCYLVPSTRQAAACGSCVNGQCGVRCATNCVNGQCRAPVKRSARFVLPPYRVRGYGYYR